MASWNTLLLILLGICIILMLIQDCSCEVEKPTAATYSQYESISKTMSSVSEEQLSYILEYQKNFPSDADSEPCQEPFPGYKPGYLDYSNICGPVQKKVKGRIVAGEETEPNEFCFQANVFISAIIGGQSRRFYCEGTVIGERWILTAAHCCHDSSFGLLNPSFWILLGAHNLSEHESSQKWYFSNKSHFHPDFDSFMLVNDVCVIQTNETIEFTPEICPACYPGPCSTPGDLTTKALKGSTLVIDGHGRTSGFGRQNISDVNRKITTQMQSLSRCNNYYGPFQDKNIYCFEADGTPKRGCFGDSGSGLRQRRNDGYRDYWMEVCPLSFGSQFCEGPNGCTKLVTPSISGWIETVTRIKPMHEKGTPYSNAALNSYTSSCSAPDLSYISNHVYY